jgi:predicted transposase YdaD
VGLGELAAEERLLASREYGEVGEMAQTFLERREARARREGRQEGRQETLQEALAAVVRNRFPAVAAEYEALIRQEEDPERLRAMFDRALVVATPEEIGLPPRA